MRSSNSLRFCRRYSASSSTSAIFCVGGLKSSSWCSLASRTICSAVICTDVTDGRGERGSGRAWSASVAGGRRGNRSRSGEGEVAVSARGIRERTGGRGRTCVGAEVLFFTRVGRGYLTEVAPWPSLVPKGPRRSRRIAKPSPATRRPRLALPRDRDLSRLRRSRSRLGAALPAALATRPRFSAWASSVRPTPRRARMRVDGPPGVPVPPSNAELLFSRPPLFVRPPLARSARWNGRTCPARACSPRKTCSRRGLGAATRRNCHRSNARGAPSSDGGALRIVV